MSDFKFNCPHCKQSLEASDDMHGDVIDCPTCQRRIQLPPADTSDSGLPQKKVIVKRQRRLAGATINSPTGTSDRQTKATNNLPASAKINCPHCKTVLSIPSPFFGKTINCPSCEGGIAIPIPDRVYPGIRRLAFALCSAAIWGAAFILGVLGLFGDDISRAFGQVVVALAHTPLVVLRLRNMGMSGWSYFLLLVPIVNLFVGPRCYFGPEGYADTHKLDTIGRIVRGAFLALGLFAIGLLFIMLTAL